MKTLPLQQAASLPTTFFRALMIAGTRAPSSHNSQPWKFVPGEQSLSVFIEPKRRLPVSDANDRQLYLSLGCAIENILIEARHHGYGVTAQYFPDPHDEELVVRLTFSSQEKTENVGEDLAAAIPLRVSNRNKYEDRLPPESFLRELRDLSTDDLHIDLIQDEQGRRQAADVLLAAIGEAMADRHFRQELSGYMKSNRTRSAVGMPGSGFGFPVLISLIAPTLVRFVNLSTLSRAQDEALLKNHTPLLVVISTRDDDKMSWLRAGQTYERIALRATQAHIATSVLAAPIQIAEYYKTLQAIVKTTFRPQLFFRMGYTMTEAPHSPRIPVPEHVS